MKKAMFATITGLLALSPFVFNGSTASAGTKVTQTVTWEDFREACTNPLAFNNQRPPENIKVICADTQYKWEVDQTRACTVGNNRELKASLLSDKYQIGEESFPVDVGPTEMTCPLIKEVKLSYSKEFFASCDDVLAFEGNMRDLCASVVDHDIAQNPDLVLREETGRIIDPFSSEQISQSIHQGVAGPKEQPALPQEQPVLPQEGAAPKEQPALPQEQPALPQEGAAPKEQPAVPQEGALQEAP